MRAVPLLALLAGCAPWITEADREERLDLDGDGVPWPADCEPDDAKIGAATPWFADEDNDGWGDPDTSKNACPPGPEGFVDNDGDCWDLDPEVRPNAEEVCNNHVDDNCNELADQCFLTGAFDLPDGADAVLSGTIDSGALGWTIRAGALDDDSVVDLAVGAFGETGAAVQSGVVYLYRGPIPDAWKAAEPAVLSGPSTGSLFGFDVLLPGDLYDTSGPSSVVVAAPYESVGYASYTGRVYLFEEAPPNATSTPATSARGIITGNAAYQRVGWSMASLGDVNGDGLPDLAVSAPYDASQGSESGAIYLFHSPIEGLVSVANANGILVGPRTYAMAGVSMENVGDTDGDGVAELLIGMPGDSCSAALTTGTAALVPVDTTGTLVLTSPNVTVLCGVGGGFGHSVAGIGDVNEDGYDDVAVGSPTEDAPEIAGAGAARFYLGPVADGALAEKATAIIRGERGSAHLGSAITPLSDVDADGAREVAILSPGADASGGSAFLFSSQLTGEHVGAEAPLQLRGWKAFGTFGTHQVIAADLDDDGYDDLAFGAPADGATPYAGAVYFIRGRGM